MKRDIWENKNIIILKRMHARLGLVINPNGVIVAGGRALEFGKDYLLVEGDQEDLLQIFLYGEEGNVLIHKIQYHD